MANFPTHKFLDKIMMDCEGARGRLQISINTERKLKVNVDFG